MVIAVTVYFCATWPFGVVAQLPARTSSRTRQSSSTDVGNQESHLPWIVKGVGFQCNVLPNYPQPEDPHKPPLPSPPADLIVVLPPGTKLKRSKKLPPHFRIAAPKEMQ